MSNVMNVEVGDILPEIVETISIKSMSIQTIDFTKKSSINKYIFS